MPFEKLSQALKHGKHDQKTHGRGGGGGGGGSVGKPIKPPPQGKPVADFKPTKDFSGSGRKRTAEASSAMKKKLGTRDVNVSRNIKSDSFKFNAGKQGKKNNPSKAGLKKAATEVFSQIGFNNVSVTAGAAPGTFEGTASR